jgi:hypothetical protein
MGHYRSEMCCQKCGGIPCKCLREPVEPMTEKEKNEAVYRTYKLFKDKKARGDDA